MCSPSMVTSSPLGISTGCMSAIDAERFLDHLPVEMPSGEEVTMDGEHITPDHQLIITATGEVIPNEPAPE